jgi:hypothetical protein
MTGTSEKVNGISSVRYEIPALDPRFLAAHRNFGAASDAVKLPESYDVTTPVPAP